jgi:hypothetical protein
LAEAIANNAVKTADVVKYVTLRGLGNGFQLGIRQGCSQATLIRGQGGSYPPGMSVNVASAFGGPDKAIVTLPPFGRGNASESPYLVSDPGLYDGIAVVQMIPDTISAGAVDQTIQFIGSGFLDSPVDSVEAVVYNVDTDTWDADPLVTVTGILYVSPTEIDVDISVDSSCPIGYKPKFQVSRT